MKKIKKFFKDVIGEIKNPSEDANKVLNVIRRVIRVMLFLSILFYMISLGFGAFNIYGMYKDGYIENYKLYSNQSLFNLYLPYVKSFIRLILNIILLIICNKSIKAGKLIKSKFILIVFLILILLQFTSYSFELHYIFGTITRLVLKFLTYGIILLSFWDIKDGDKEESELNKKRIYRISLFGYVLLIIHLIQKAVSLIYSSLYYLIDYKDIVTYLGATMWDWLALIAYMINIVLFIGSIALLIFSLIGRKKELKKIRKKSYLIVILFFISIFVGIINYLVISGEYLYFMVFALAVSYQNKYKLFHNQGIGTRIFKTTIEKVKTGFNNYLSFKE